ncbi:hypothetical protein [Fluviispira vulneris]|uniref:hypothetical protein n=1 Tax=Fluviispira vulneris TaxID=2763012 RepID=UPI00164799E6|nr:hypothetical protein [Fluviispira vulneris]
MINADYDFLEKSSIKKIDLELYLNGIKKLSEFSGVAEDSILKGWKFYFTDDLVWKSEFSQEIKSKSEIVKFDRLPDLITIKSGENLLIIKNLYNIIVNTEFKSDKINYHISGLALKIVIKNYKNEEYNALNNFILRKYISYKKDFYLPDDLHIRTNNYYHYLRSSYSNIVIDHNPEIELIKLNQEKILIFESKYNTDNVDMFLDVASKLKVFLSYLTGCLSMSNYFITISDHKNNILKQIFIRGSKELDSNFHPVPISLIREENENSEIICPLDSKVISGCFNKILSNIRILYAIEYILLAMSEQSAIDVRGSLLSVSLEIITDIIKESNENNYKKVINDKMIWIKLKETLINKLDEFEISNENKRIIKNRIDNLNSPTNKEKLNKPFELYGIDLSKEEQKCIATRNDYLHGNEYLRLDDKKVKKSDNINECFFNEKMMYNLVNKILLKYLGYKGYLINWTNPMINPNKPNIFKF